MSKIKNFFVSINKKIKLVYQKCKNSINKFVSKIDKKIKPKSGHFWYRFFTIFSRILFMIIFPTIIILIGVDAYNVILNVDEELHRTAIITCGVIYIVLQFFAIFMKRYFAKWRNYRIISTKNSKNEEKNDLEEKDLNIEKKQIEKN